MATNLEKRETDGPWPQPALVNISSIPFSFHLQLSKFREMHNFVYCLGFSKRFFSVSVLIIFNHCNKTCFACETNAIFMYL